MTGAKIVEVDEAGWGQATAQFLDNNFEQSYAYALEAAKRAGAEARFLTIRFGKTGGEIISAATIRLKKMPIVGGGIAYLAAGPMVCRRGSQDAPAANVRLAVQALRQKFVGEGSYILRIRPAVRKYTPIGDFAAVFEEEGFRETHSAGQNLTYLVDLSRDNDEIRRGLKQKWRNCLNAADRGELSIQIGQGANWLARFGGLYHDLLDRKKFSTDLEFSFYKRVEELAQGDERFWVIIISQGGVDIAGHVGSILGDTAVYILGASNDAGRSAKAAYLANWTAMMHAKENGCSWYDLGGIDPEGNPGVTRYKAGLGGEEAPVVGTFELAPEGLRSRLTLFGEAAYHQLRHLGR